MHRRLDDVREYSNFAYKLFVIYKFVKLWSSTIEKVKLQN